MSKPYREGVQTAAAAWASVNRIPSPASRGVELQVTANPGRNWRLQANYAIADAVEENKFAEWLNWDKLMVPYLARFDQNLLTSRGETLRNEILFYQGELRSQTETAGVGKLGNRTRHADDGSVFRFVVQPPTTWRFTTTFEF